MWKFYLDIASGFEYIALHDIYSPHDISGHIKGAEATCVKIATEMNKCSRLKEMSNFNVPCNFQPI